jgi:hypothetical protein
MRLRLAVTKQYLYTRDEARKKKFVDGDAGRAGEWKALWDQIDPKFRNMRQSDNDALAFLNEIVPTARKRGLYVAAWRDDLILVATGPKAFRENKLEKIREHCHWMSITPGEPAKQYDVWVGDTTGRGLISQNRLDALSRKLNYQYEIFTTKPTGGDYDYFDICVVPARGADNKFTIYMTGEKGSKGNLSKYVWDTRSIEYFNDWTIITSRPLSQVRVVTPSAVRPDDPDKDAMPENLLKGDSIIYGTFPNSRDIFVYVNGTQYSVENPMDVYSGISVDPYFLWIYGRDGFMCVTHASVMGGINKKPQMPRWLGNGNPKNIRHALDLSSCADGTLFVANDKLQTATYHIAFNKLDEGMWVVIDGDWETVLGGGGLQCQKLPIYCWPQIESMAATLAQPSA